MEVLAGLSDHFIFTKLYSVDNHFCFIGACFSLCLSSFANRRNPGGFFGFGSFSSAFPHKVDPMR
jgi:hypothetical protein